VTVLCHLFQKPTGKYAVSGYGGQGDAKLHNIVLVVDVPCNFAVDEGGLIQLEEGKYRTWTVDGAVAVARKGWFGFKIAKEKAR
jgi:hypothetical protein